MGERLDAEGAQKKELIAPHVFYPFAKRGRGGVRSSQNRVQVDHHAPQLIRLVRHPYTERGTAMKPMAGTGREREQPVARERYRKELEASLAIDRTVDVLRPTSVHLRPEPRPRPSAGDWLAQRGEVQP